MVNHQGHTYTYGNLLILFPLATTWTMMWPIWIQTILIPTGPFMKIYVHPLASLVIPIFSSLTCSVDVRSCSGVKWRLRQGSKVKWIGFSKLAFHRYDSVVGASKDPLGRWKGLSGARRRGRTHLSSVQFPSNPVGKDPRTRLCMQIWPICTFSIWSKNNLTKLKIKLIV